MPRLDGALAQLLERQPIVILDGGFATELEQRGIVLDGDLWSAKLLVNDPRAIERLHLDYLEAGADCIVSASYQASIQGFEAHGLDAEQAERALLRSVDLAMSARDAFERKSEFASRARPLVAAGVGPYGAYLADGSEFTGAYDLDEDGLVEFHRDRWELLAGAGADLLACETIPALVEARALVRLLELTPWTEAWISFSCRNERALCDGTDLAEAVELTTASPGVAAVGINCTAPRFISPLLERARCATDKPLVVYPNSGETWDPEGRCWVDADTRFDLAAAAEEWVGLGARLIGGCCRTGPEDIRRLRQRLL